METHTISYRVPGTLVRAFLGHTQEVFEGNESLFEGLYIRDHWDWSIRHPVLRLDFSGGSYHEPGSLHEDVMRWRNWTMWRKRRGLRPGTSVPRRVFATDRGTESVAAEALRPVEWQANFGERFAIYLNIRAILLAQPRDEGVHRLGRRLLPQQGFDAVIDQG